jgi:hypothetical protein
MGDLFWVGGKITAAVVDEYLVAFSIPRETEAERSFSISHSNQCVSDETSMFLQMYSPIDIVL